MNKSLETPRNDSNLSLYFKNYLKNEIWMSQDFYHLQTKKELVKWLSEAFETFLIWIAWDLKFLEMYTVSAFPENLNVKKLW